MNKWKKITTKYSNKCIQCNDFIMQGQTALWMEGLGIKHVECPVIQKDPPKDESVLIIIENDDKERLGIK